MASEVTDKTENNHATSTLISTAIGATIGLLLGKWGDNDKQKVGQWVLSLGGGLVGYFLSMYANRRKTGEATVVEASATPVVPASVAPVVVEKDGPKPQVSAKDAALDGMVQADALEKVAAR